MSQHFGMQMTAECMNGTSTSQYANIIAYQRDILTYELVNVSTS